MRTIRIALVAILIVIFIAPVVAQEEKCQSLSCFLQSAKIQYQHVYKKSRMREDLYHCINLLKEAAQRYGHKPEVYYFIGTFYAEINAFDTVVAYFDSVETFCADESILAEDRKNCTKKDNYMEKMKKLRLDRWERSYNDAVEFLTQYDTVASWMTQPLSEDSLKVLDSLKERAYSAAYDGFKTALIAMPKESKTYDAIGALLEREEKYNDAIDIYMKAIEEFGESGSLVSRIAYDYIQMKEPDWDKVIEWFLKYYTYKPDDVNTIINLSVAYNIKGDFDTWYEYVEKLLALEPANTQFLVYAGQYWFTKMQDVALQMSGITDSTDDAKARRADLDAKAKEYMQKSQTYLEKAVDIDAQNIDALKRLGVLYLLSGKNEEAVEDFEKLLKIERCDVDGLDYLGRAYINLGKFIEAIRVYEILVDCDPGNADAWERLAELYEYNKLPDKAIEAKAKADELKKL